MLAPTLDGNQPSVAPIARVRARSVAFDAALLCAALTCAGILFYQGGMEALLGAWIGTVLGARTVRWRNARVSGAISGAFSGLFAGALFASFFHEAIATLF